ncbi:hypothetical protein RCC89_20235 [Cytophagaceae bacterium ABcell3]|nr:hypothetical protein RCC89_20235 [Cytophagaceae bacterium ABcell3]
MIGKIKYLIFFAVISSLTISCSESENSDDNSSYYYEETFDFEINPSIELIVKPAASGTFRGVSLGTLRDDVLKIEETTQIINDSPESIVYRVNYDVNQDVDVEYFFDDQSKVVKIQAYLYPQNKEEQKVAFKELLNYFEYSFGTPDFSSENQVIWKSRLGEFEIMLKKQGNVKVHDVEIEINPIVFTPSALSSIK